MSSGSTGEILVDWGWRVGSLVLMGTLKFLLEGWFDTRVSAPDLSQGESALSVNSVS